MSYDKKIDAIEKWRFAHISWLLQSESSDEEKVSALQELYAEFGFPEDMASCSIYSGDQIDPLLAAGRIVKDFPRCFLPAASLDAP
jgi:hypothetical protein